MHLNFSTSAGGYVYVEIQDVNGKPISGFTKEECAVVFGDSVDRKVSWESGSKVGVLSNKDVRLRFIMKDADIYSMQFKR